MNQNISLLRLLWIMTLLIFSQMVTASSSNEANDLQRFKMLYQYAMLSNAAYLGKADIEKNLAASGYKLIAQGQLPGYQVAYFLANNDLLKQQVLVVRGTSNIENAMVDVALKLLPDKQTGIKLHQGFALSADLIYAKVKPYLNKNYRINTTGHSLGGAAALVLAMYMDSGGFQVGKVITFGQPKVTNINGSKRYSHLDLTRVVMPKDMVPLVPPLDPMDLMNMDVYWHAGTEVVLQKANTYTQLEGMDSMMRATDFLNEMMSEKNLQQHYMSLYISSLSQKQLNPKRIPYKNDFKLLDLFGG